MFGPPTPILRSFDERRAKRFYVDFLGFEILFGAAALFLALLGASAFLTPSRFLERGEARFLRLTQ